MDFVHRSAMPDEVIRFLDPNPGQVYVDGTMGGAGHSQSILKRILPGGRLIAIDQDQDAILNAKKVFADYEGSVSLVHGNFAALPQILASLDIERVDGIVIDIGLSQNQLERSGRGFSFTRDEPLDMRMDVRNSETAASMVNELGEQELANIFFKFGEERFSRQIARRILQERASNPIETSSQLAKLVENVIPARHSAKQKIHPATRVFQALRIAVNQELEKLQSFLDTFVTVLNPGGRLCVLSFHSLEDRLVKKKIRELETDCVCPRDFPVCVCGTVPQVKRLTRKVVRPGSEELERNPMARSTRLRACEKL